MLAAAASQNEKCSSERPLVWAPNPQIKLPPHSCALPLLLIYDI